eukprot:scaffold11564_cov116-Isochrysis_galbana.AAC.3
MWTTACGVRVQRALKASGTPHAAGHLLPLAVPVHHVGADDNTMDDECDGEADDHGYEDDDAVDEGGGGGGDSDLGLDSDRQLPVWRCL